MGRIWTIRLYPVKKSSLFVRVLVFEHRRTMLRFAKEERVVGMESAGAWCQETHVIAIRKGKPDRRRPVVACVVLDKAKMGIGVVAHELFHATSCWARRVGIRWECGKEDGVGTFPPNHPEERLAMIHYHLVTQFCRRAYALGLYDAA